MNFIEENSSFLESSPIYENIPSPNYCPLPQEINIIPKEDLFFYAQNDDGNKYKEPLTIFNEKFTKDTKDVEDLIDEKKLFFIDKEKHISKIPLLHQNFRKFFKTQKEKLNEDKKNDKLCGEKRVRNDKNYEKQPHNKFSNDILIRKCKYLVIKNTFEFLNKQIKNVYKGNLGRFIFKKELKIINQSQISNSNIDFNKNFMTKTLGDIFSDDISNKYTNFRNNHNKNLIYNLMNEKDENKKKYFQKLFNLNFIQCIRHFSGEEHNDLLNGLKSFKDIKNEIINDHKEEDVEYCDILEYYLKNYEQIINNKRSRKPKK